MERMASAPRCGGVSNLEGKYICRQRFELQFEAVEIVAPESRGKNMLNLLVIAGDSQFLSGATDRQVVDEDLGLIESAVGDAGQFTKLEISQVLDTDPDS